MIDIMKSMSDIAEKVKERRIGGTFNAIKNRFIRMANSMLIRIKIRKLLRDYGIRFVQNLDIEEIRQRTLEFIEVMRIKDAPYGQYKYCKSTKEPVLYASIYAVLTRHLYRDLSRLTERQRKEWIDHIQSFQSEDGLFKDTAVKNERGEIHMGGVENI